jgi:hypothetical protein
MLHIHRTRRLALRAARERIEQCRKAKKQAGVDWSEEQLQNIDWWKAYWRDVVRVLHDGHT